VTPKRVYLNTQRIFSHYNSEEHVRTSVTSIHSHTTLWPTSIGALLSVSILQTHYGDWRKWFCVSFLYALLHFLMRNATHWSTMKTRSATYRQSWQEGWLSPILALIYKDTPAKFCNSSIQKPTWTRSWRSAVSFAVFVNICAKFWPFVCTANNSVLFFTFWIRLFVKWYLLVTRAACQPQHTLLDRYPQCDTYEAGMVCLQCKNCVIHTWVLQRWAYYNGALYKCLHLHVWFILAGSQDIHDTTLLSFIFVYSKFTLFSMFSEQNFYYPKTAAYCT